MKKKSIIVIVFLLTILVACSNTVTNDTPDETDLSDATPANTSGNPVLYTGCDFDPTVTPIYYWESDTNKNYANSLTGGSCGDYDPTVEPIIITDSKP